jgi:methyltransferase
VAGTDRVFLDSSIEQRLQPGLRCTVKIEPSAYKKPGPLHGEVVSPREQTEANGTYWGYTVRLASSLQAVWDECPFDTKYDLKIGTSERGNESVDDRKFALPSYHHALIVLGGVAGIEECVDADESLKIGGNLSHTLFDKWVNVCPYQGSRTIRTEEAILITLAKLNPQLLAAGINEDTSKETQYDEDDDSSPVLAQDASNLSDESSDNE